LRRQIVTIGGGVRSVKLELGGAGIEIHVIGIAVERSPGCGIGHARQDRHRTPDKIHPRALRPAPLDDDADGNADPWLAAAHRTIFRPRMGRTLSKFWGFMRRIWSGVMARMR